MAFVSKLLSSCSMSAIYSFLNKYLRYRQTLTSSGSVENIQPMFGLPGRDPFLTLRDPCLGRGLHFGNHWPKWNSAWARATKTGKTALFPVRSSRRREKRYLRYV